MIYGHCIFPVLSQLIHQQDNIAREICTWLSLFCFIAVISSKLAGFYIYPYSTGLLQCYGNGLSDSEVTVNETVKSKWYLHIIATTTNMYIARAVYESQPALGLSMRADHRDGLLSSNF